MPSYSFCGIVIPLDADDTLDSMRAVAAPLLGLSTLVLGLAAGQAAAEPWSRTRIERLPDSAFAVIEIAPEGRKIRHLPHHDETGAVDPPHLRAARARFYQVRWLDQASAEIARRHLDAHTSRAFTPAAPGARDR